MLIFRINLNTQVIKHQSAMLLNDFRLSVIESLISNCDSIG